MQQDIKICHGTILTPYRKIDNGCIILRDGKIAEVSNSDIELENGQVIDAKGCYVAPGFIDIHVHGGGGSDFMDATEMAFLTIAETHVKYGTTAMMPTTLTSTRESLLQTLSAYDKADKANHRGAKFIGMHLEGPYLAMSQRGAQDPRFIRNPDPGEYEEIIAQFPCVRRWSAAPELPGAIDFGRFMKSRNILPAIAHTDAIYEDVLAAFESGFTLITHLYSAMSGVTRRNAYRYAGVIESAYIIDDMDVELIADGVHVPGPLLKLVYKSKGPDRTALITDAMRAAGMPEGNSILGGLHTGIDVIVEDGVAKLPDRSSFAGSVATADRLVRTMVECADIPLLDAVRMMTATPARIAGVADTKGALTVGRDADIVIFNDDIRIQTTIVNGKTVYNR